MTTRYDITVRLTETQVRVAACRYLWRSMRRLWILVSICFLLGLLGLVLAAMRGEGEFVAPLIMTLLPGVSALRFLQFMHQRVKAFRSLDDPCTLIRLSEEGLSLSNEIGSTTLRWMAFNDIWKYPDMWLLIGRLVGYVTLPTALLDDAASSFLDDHVRNSAPWPPKCVKCGYDLRGSTRDRCPECGYRYVQMQTRTETELRRTGGPNVDAAVE